MSKPPKTVRGQGAIAALICKEFKTECFQQTIARWRKSEGVKSAIAFPAPGPAGTYNVKKSFAWYRENILPYKNDAATRPLRDEIKLKKDERELALLDRELAEKDNLLIDRATAERTAIGVIQRLRNVFIAQDENELPKFCDETLKALNCSAEIKAAFVAKYIEKARAITDRRIAQFELATKDAGKIGV